MDIRETIVDAIGDTPLVRLGRLHPPGNLVAKIEAMNPGGSVKDRIGLGMIERAEQNGWLEPGGTIVEPTSGNTGVGLAMAAALKGYNLVAVMADKQSKEKRDLLRAYGAEVIVCPTDVSPDDPRSYYSVADRLTEELEGAYRPDQYSNPANPQAQYETTGPEIWRDTGGNITHFVSAMGTTGTIVGTARFLREQNPRPQIIGVQPEEGASIPGIRRWPVEYIPEIFDASLVDREMDVTQEEAEIVTRRLAAEEGIFAGISSGGSVSAALRLSQETENAVIVAIICDRGDRYLSTGVFPAT